MTVRPLPETITLSKGSSVGGQISSSTVDVVLLLAERAMVVVGVEDGPRVDVVVGASVYCVVDVVAAESGPPLHAAANVVKATANALVRMNNKRRRTIARSHGTRKAAELPHATQFHTLTAHQPVK